MSVVAINPNDMTLNKKEDHTNASSVEDILNTTIEYANGGHISLSEVLNNIDDLGSLEQPILRSALEDMDTSMCHYDRFSNTLIAPSNETQTDVTLLSHQKTDEVAGCSITSIINNIPPNGIIQPSCPDSLQPLKHGKLIIFLKFPIYWFI